MKSWQQTADEHWAGLTDKEKSDPRVRNLVRYAADLEQAEQAENGFLVEQILARYDRTVKRLGYDPLA